ncbi:cell division protein ZapA [Taibaiella chishuiensis]|uniref:Cell division protein ZapA n=1 Tax=Taibaiella chishuiensis TaxID=1434707 RepID=A0A2P8D449_9BACT|nr:cell division protein ZapA [Taibaiella chishuiensis]PSK91994.1 cell division protein ZapA [Taibaiella chishuiensis]
MEDLIPVTLWIAGRGYRIRIRKEDEAAVRLAVKIADERVNELRNSFAGKDDQDFIAMCLLMYATDQVTEANALNPVQKELVGNMTAKIDKLIGEG